MYFCLAFVLPEIVFSCTLFWVFVDRYLEKYTILYYHSTLEQKINALNEVLTAAQTALEAPDVANKPDLEYELSSVSSSLKLSIGSVKKSHEDAGASLEKAIKAVQQNLDDAIVEHNKEITDGDTTLDAKVTGLNEALAMVQSTLEAKDAEPEAKDAEHDVQIEERRALTLDVGGILGVTLCGGGALALWFFFGRKR